MRFIILSAALAGALFLAAWYYNSKSDFLAIDGCLDSGGCWDYATRVCRKDEENAQALCDASRNEAPDQP